MGALEFAGKEFQSDVGGFELFGQGGEFDSAPESFVFVHDQGERGAGGADLGRQGDGLVEFARNSAGCRRHLVSSIRARYAGLSGPRRGSSPG
ncbi:hypothetical protein P3H15_28095 [Rhodococcus sp. T2V]|uniref:hypothetical protein n=1 Tax=Rhodococcus sp. T2V TaxID=3034164 RepID=UPI0023E15C80|nr:hypothetical protein [Rhodococcus sp. T2V]MDF3308882.1 hypothetical protein [Rhodococcus sp. T2V]